VIKKKIKDSEIVARVSFKEMYSPNLTFCFFHCSVWNHQKSFWSMYLMIKMIYFLFMTSYPKVVLRIV
jgi:hypothetical protein